MRQMLRDTRGTLHATREELNAKLAQLEAELSSERQARAADQEHLAKLAARVGDLEARTQEAAATARSEHRQLVEILRFVHGQDKDLRRRLRKLRREPGYEAPFTAPGPLISVVITTIGRHEMLSLRSIPSVLAQTHQNFEIIVGGDATPPETQQALEAFQDPRISFFNLNFAGPYPADIQSRWLVGGVPAYNEALARARGHWIACLDDDDAWRPHHLECLLHRAKEDRLELAYGILAQHLSDGSEQTLGGFPPQYQQFGMQASLYHAGVAKIFELELGDAALGIPSDWGVTLRMMECGVRIGMVDEVTVDYYPSTSWEPSLDPDRFRRASAGI